MRDAEAVTFAGASFDRATHLCGRSCRDCRLRADPSARCRLAPRAGGAAVARSGRGGAARLVAGRGAGSAASGERRCFGIEAGGPRFSSGDPAPGADDPTALRLFFDASTEWHPICLRRCASPISGRGWPFGAGCRQCGGREGHPRWHASHRLRCCGAVIGLQLFDAGWKRICPACGTQHFRD